MTYFEGIITRSSDNLHLGGLYTRSDLKDLFSIRAASLNNGIFQPPGHASVWLFITAEKSKDRTPYLDRLQGKILECDGQKMGRTDSLILESEKKGNELLLFYRSSRKEQAHGAFRYMGRLKYSYHTGAKPAHFFFELLD